MFDGVWESACGGGESAGPPRGAGERILELANDNAAGYWLAQAQAFGWETWRRPGYAAVRSRWPGGERHLAFVLREPSGSAGSEGTDPAELIGLFRAWDSRELRVEDPYRALDLSRYGCAVVSDFAVMARMPEAVAVREGAEVASAASAAAPAADPEQAPDAAPEAVRSAIRVAFVADPGQLAAAERVVVEGFPVPDRMPWRPGVLYQPELLDVPGVRVWLAHREGVAAAVCVTYDDGAAVGLYWVTTLPEHRSRGVGRALLETALAPYRDRVVTLTATAVGEPLYRRLGFTELTRARWWQYPAPPVPAGG